jgi:hypothetical protein
MSKSNLLIVLSKAKSSINNKAKSRQNSAGKLSPPAGVAVNRVRLRVRVRLVLIQWTKYINNKAKTGLVNRASGHLRWNSSCVKAD